MKFLYFGIIIALTAKLNTCFGQIPMMSYSYENLKKVHDSRPFVLGEPMNDQRASFFLGYGNAQFGVRGGDFNLRVNPGRPDSIIKSFSNRESTNIHGVSFGLEITNFKMNKLYFNISADIAFRGSNIQRNIFYFHVGRNIELSELFFLRYIGGIATGSGNYAIGKFNTENIQFEISGNNYEPTNLSVSLVTNPFIMRAGLAAGIKWKNKSLTFGTFYNENFSTNLKVKFSGKSLGAKESDKPTELKLNLRNNDLLFSKNAIVRSDFFSYNGFQWVVSFHYTVLY